MKLEDAITKFRFSGYSIRRTEWADGKSILLNADANENAAVLTLSYNDVLADDWGRCPVTTEKEQRIDSIVQQVFADDDKSVYTSVNFYGKESVLRALVLAYEAGTINKNP